MQKSSSVATDAGGDTLVKESQEQKSIGSHPKGSHYVFTLCPKDPDCDMCRRTKSTRARCNTKSKKSMSEIVRAPKSGDLITADHTIPNVG